MLRQRYFDEKREARPSIILPRMPYYRLLPLREARVVSPDVAPLCAAGAIC